MATPKQDISNLIFPAHGAVDATVRYITQARADLENGFGLAFPVREIAENFPIVPLLPGKVATVQAKSRNGKSLFLSFWLSQAAKMYAEDSRSILISVSVENMVEEQIAATLLRKAAQIGKKAEITKEDGLLIAAAQVGAMPIYYVGLSLERAGEAPPPTMSNVYRAIRHIVDRRKDAGVETLVRGVFFDYIQAMPIDPEIMKAVVDRRRRLQVRADFFAMRKLAAVLPAPIVVASQSKAVLEGAPGKDMQTPGLYDHQETSAIAQHTDVDFSLWMPKTESHLLRGEQVMFGMVKFPVEDNFCWLRVNKQRGIHPVTLRGLPSDRSFPLWIDFETGEYALAQL